MRIIKTTLYPENGARMFATYSASSGEWHLRECSTIKIRSTARHGVPTSLRKGPEDVPNRTSDTSDACVRLNRRSEVIMGARGRGHMRLTAEDVELDATSEHHKGSFRNYMIVKNRHLHQQFEHHAADLKAAGSGSDIFRGVSIHVNGFTTPTHQVTSAKESPTFT